MLRKAIVSFIICALLLTSVSTHPGIYAASDKETLSTEYARSTVERLNVRAEPSLQAKVLSQIGKSHRYEVLEKQSEWVKIRLTDDVDGWVFREYIAFESGEPPAKEAPKRAVADIRLHEATQVKIVDVTNLRSGPSTEHGVIGKAQPGAAYPIAGREGDWYIVTLPNKRKGYVASWVVETDFLSRNTELTSSLERDEQEEPAVYIYHSHNRESWLHVMLDKGASSASDEDVNITLVGKHLARLLQERGIPALTEAEDFAETLKQENLKYNQSYEVSRRAVDRAREAHPTLTYFFDIHRDANVAREKTAITIDGKTYARVLFVIGTAHDRYEENKAFAEHLDELLQEQYPGLSRGILTKGTHQGDGEYNQSVSPGSLLIEIGSTNNTLEESLHTAEALANIFAQYWVRQADAVSPKED